MAANSHPHVIHTIAGFLKELKIGDIFWYMTSCDGRPEEIFGPCTIFAFLADRYPVVRYHRDIEEIHEDYIKYLTNEFHGVFLNAADAYTYLEQCKIAYLKDPAYYVRRIARQKQK